MWWREELRDLSTQHYYHIRKTTLELESRLRDRIYELEAGDLFHVSMKDLLAYLNAEINDYQLLKIIKRNRNYYQSFSNYSPPNEIGYRFQDEASGREAEFWQRMNQHTHNASPCTICLENVPSQALHNLEETAPRLRSASC